MPDINPDIKPLPINGQKTGLCCQKRSYKKPIIIGVCLTIAVVVGGIVSGFFWYNNQLTPVDVNDGQLKLVTIEYGSTPSQVGEMLEGASIIRSAKVFDVYTRLSGKQNSLQAGTYRLSPSETTQQIVEHLVNGSVDQFSITLFPGATLVDKSSASKKYDVTTALKNAGYTDQEIMTAFKASYSGPLFEGRPVGADLEGYVYGQTYNLNTGASAEDALNRAFDEFYQVVQDNDLIKKFKAHGLNLYQGITLASIIQREASSATDQKQVAQVFYSRLEIGMMLGSDVTYQYVADKLGVVRDTNLDSPYNTRRYAGLPPGPIAVPGLTALQAVADPASGDYLFFLSGDDDVTYFARTVSEHEANIVKHCAVKCSTP